MTSKLTSMGAGTYALAPDLLWSKSGSLFDHVLSVSGGDIISVLPRSDFSAVYPEIEITDHPGRAIIPGFSVIPIGISSISADCDKF